MTSTCKQQPPSSTYASGDGCCSVSPAVSPLRVTANTVMQLFLLMLLFTESAPMLEDTTSGPQGKMLPSTDEEGDGDEWKWHATRSNGLFCTGSSSPSSSPSTSPPGSCYPQIKVAVLNFQTDGIGEDLLFTIAVTNTDPELHFPGGYLHVTEEREKAGSYPTPSSSPPFASSSLYSTPPSFPPSYIGTPAPFKVPKLAPLQVEALRVKIHCMHNKHYQPPKREPDTASHSWMPQHEDSNARALAKIPRGLIFTLISFDGQSVATEPYQFLFGAFVANEMARYRTVADANYRFVLEGIRGSSRSGFVNSVHHLILRSGEDGHVIHLAHTGSGDKSTESTTLTVNEYAMPNGAPFTLIDTPGMTPDNYKEDQMEDILTGNYCPNRWDLTMESKGFKDNWVGKRADAALFFIPQEMVGDPAITPLLRNFSSLANRLGIPFVIVISKVDTLDYTLALDALAPSEELKASYLGVRAQAMVGWQSITHLLSYHSDNSRSDFNIDRQTYIVFKKLLNLIRVDTSGTDLVVMSIKNHLIAIVSFFTYWPWNPQRALRDLVYNEDVSAVVVSILVGCASFTAGYKLWPWFIRRR